MFGALRDRGQRVARDQHGVGEVLLRGLKIAAVELILVGERNGVDHEIDLAPLLLHLGKHRVDARRIGDIAMAERDRAEFLGQRLDALLQRIALPGQRQFSALVAARFRDPVSDGAVVRHAQDHAALAAHQAHIFSHELVSRIRRSLYPAAPSERTSDTKGH